MTDFEETIAFKKAVLQHLHPGWPEEKLLSEATQETIADIAQEKKYLSKLNGLLSKTELLKQDNWSWCGLCNCPIITCEHCNNSSCNGSGCDQCEQRFNIATALSYASAGDLAQEAPVWYTSLCEKLEKEFDYEACSICCFKRLDFARTMITNRVFAEEHLAEFACSEHGTALVDKFYAEINRDEELTVL